MYRAWISSHNPANNVGRNYLSMSYALASGTYVLISRWLTIPVNTVFLWQCNQMWCIPWEWFMACIPHIPGMSSTSGHKTTYIIHNREDHHKSDPLMSIYWVAPVNIDYQYRIKEIILHYTPYNKRTVVMPLVVVCLWFLPDPFDLLIWFPFDLLIFLWYNFHTSVAFILSHLC